MMKKNEKNEEEGNERIIDGRNLGSLNLLCHAGYPKLAKPVATDRELFRYWIDYS